MHYRSSLQHLCFDWYPTYTSCGSLFRSVHCSNTLLLVHLRLTMTFKVSPTSHCTIGQVNGPAEWIDFIKILENKKLKKQTLRTTLKIISHRFVYARRIYVLPETPTTNVIMLSGIFMAALLWRPKIFGSPVRCMLPLLLWCRARIGALLFVFSQMTSTSIGMLSGTPDCPLCSHVCRSALASHKHESVGLSIKDGEILV